MSTSNHLPDWIWKLLTSENWVRLQFLRLSVYVCSRLVASGADPASGPRVVEETLLGIARGDASLPSEIASEDALELWLYDAVAQRLSADGEN